MLHPSYTDLMAAINSDIEEGEQPIVQSRYSIVIATAKRARQIIAGAKPMVEKAAGKKPLSIAVEELYNGDVKITGADDDMEDDDIVLDYSNDMLEMSLEEESEDDQADLQTDGEEAEQEEDRDEEL
ncbi:MAG TPA: DNA-directed RNA polymerase subunit omega [Candidatus Scybalocola faecipullorum]|nr:DNA-directed RNA polymerase subunit omega [Candidatus Scybalocola faecipullorum]